ncbi:MAG: carbamate kinase, partial [Desulfuromonadales bacterium]|nr:carbamate kinase [Desulfuromonadales bacterium]
RMTAAEAKQYMAEGEFATGSMRPKVQAALNFLERGGKRAIITSPDHLVKAVQEDRGTHIVP